ncbi:MAG: aminopeptidase [Deltaproteobacteria bacterium]|nr:aminopeptidase [Deltaproteobacteria bacterium]MBW2043950.1 aminopeptidase [Deltaproteobacteria bacterium]MBW2301401.1 aminopeptidase [Deltaproteobacteria bacterium]
MKKAIIRIPTILFVLITVSISLVLSGCSFRYIMHAAVGELKLLSNSVPIEKALRDPSLSEEQKERLLLVAKIKAFGESELGLKKTASYETAYLKSDQPPIYFLSASPKDRLSLVTWWFPILGKMPYLGFFDVQRAREEEKKLEAKGLDTFLGRADAYSTLGWFKDPVTLNLIKESSYSLAETILHEMTHATLYVRGQGEFNEGLAVLVGKEGSKLFFEKVYGPFHPFTIQAKNSLHDEEIFSGFLSSLIQELRQIYESPLSYQEKIAKREVIFSDSKKKFEALKEKLRTPIFLGYEQAPLNNAYIMCIGLYHAHFKLFLNVLKHNGNSIKEMLSFLKELSEAKGDMLQLMKGWLDTQQALGPRESRSSLNERANTAGTALPLTRPKSESRLHPVMQSCGIVK